MTLLDKTSGSGDTYLPWNEVSYGWIGLEHSAIYALVCLDETNMSLFHIISVQSV